jgi:hypothetical protein
MPHGLLELLVCQHALEEVSRTQHYVGSHITVNRVATPLIDVLLVMRSAVFYKLTA